MNKEEQTTDETIEVGNTDTSEEQNSDAQTPSDTDTATEPSNDDSLPDESRDDLQTEPDPGETETTESQPSRSEPDAEYMSILRSVDQHLSKLEELFMGQIARNQNQKQMFDTIYREMTSYKEDALLDAYHKPIIHNLIQLYDNLERVKSQLEGIRKTFESLGAQSDDVSGTFESFGIWFGGLRRREREKLLKKLRPSDEKLATELERFGKVSADKSSPSQANTELTDEPAQSQERQEDGLSLSQLKGELSQFQENLENVRYELEEVLYRMDVTPYEEHPEKLVPKLHKTLKTIPIDDPDKDREVVDIHKTGFKWHERVFRPEEVTIFRYTQPAGKPEETVVENSTDEKGDETDG